MFNLTWQTGHDQVCLAKAHVLHPPLIQINHSWAFPVAAVLTRCCRWIRAIKHPNPLTAQMISEKRGWITVPDSTKGQPASVEFINSIYATGFSLDRAPRASQPWILSLSNLIESQQRENPHSVLQTFKVTACCSFLNYVQTYLALPLRMPFLSKTLWSVFKMEGQSSQSGINSNWRLYFTQDKVSN